MIHLKRLRRFGRREYGAVTVEAALWLPLLIGLISLVVDLSLMLLNHADMWNIASDTVRQLSVGEIKTDEAQQYANDLSFRGTGYTVTVAQDDEIYTATVSIPMKSVSITSWFMDSDATLAVSVAQRGEPTS